MHARRSSHLRGHTPGSVALVYEGDPERPHVFSGDSLFPGGVGNTEKDPSRFARLIDDVERKLFGPLPDETWVYPGHGARHDAGRRAAEPAGVARARLVAPGHFEPSAVAGLVLRLRLPDSPPVESSAVVPAPRAVPASGDAAELVELVRRARARAQAARRRSLRLHLQAMLLEHRLALTVLDLEMDQHLRSADGAEGLRGQTGRALGSAGGEEPQAAERRRLRHRPRHHVQLSGRQSDAVGRSRRSCR